MSLLINIAKLLAICILLFACNENQSQPAIATEKIIGTDLPAPVPPLITEPAKTTVMPAGKPLDFGPAKGQPLYVVGVKHDDQLNIRSTPDTNAAILMKLPPVSRSVYSMGLGWQLPSGAIWWQVELDDGKQKTLGWANIKYLAGLGKTTNISDRLKHIKKSSVENLANTIAAELTGNATTNNLVLIENVHGIDAQGGAMQFDLLGYKDDSVLGERIRVVFDFIWDDTGPSRRATDQANIRLVFSTTICARGTSNGACI